ncbi:unnamed protein product [Alternaria alternata]
MDIPASSENYPFKPRLRSNISYPPTPLLDEESSRPTLQIISYDSATVPITPMVLTYDLQGKAYLSRHIRFSPLIGVSGSAMIELRKEPHYVSNLQAAEKEIRNAMECLLMSIECRKRSSSTSSGEVVAEWVGGLEKQDTDEVVKDDFESKDSYFNAKMAALRVGCSCVIGCYKSVAFAEDLANRLWPKEWVVNVEHRSIFASV